MTPLPNRSLVFSSRTLARFTSALIMLVGASVWTGWASDLTVLKSLWPYLATIKANIFLACSRCIAADATGILK